ncbi:RNA-binding protein [Candidatus Bathyarchaeota archaeon]|jgi:PUA domain protein|nr:RNA-binding protein [Candidatus Bathyarchaeota archaeon]
MLRKRKSLKRKAAKKLFEELSSVFGEIDAERVESAVLEDVTVYLLDYVVEFVRDGDAIYPFLGGSHVDGLPRVVVDMGAIPYVCNGADVMAPGIADMDSFEVGDLVVVRDVTHGKALAIGKALKSSSDIEASRKGKVIENLHYVGDSLWKAA